MEDLEELIKDAANEAASICYGISHAQRQVIIENAIRKVLMEERNNASQSS